MERLRTGQGAETSAYGVLSQIYMDIYSYTSPKAKEDHRKGMETMKVRGWERML